MEIKIGLKIGRMELQFEGSEKTFDDKIVPILSDLIDFGKESGLSAEPAQSEVISAAKSPTAPIAMTVKSIANKIGGASGNDLLYAAIVSLAIVKRKETFTRKEINDEMKMAVGHYKATYTGNLTGYLDAMSKQGTIIETAKDVYALKETERQIMEQKLAQ